MADLTITAANVVAVNSVTPRMGLAGETMTAGKAVYFNTTTNRWMLADADSVTAEARQAIGIAMNGASSGQPVDVFISGDLTIGATLTLGAAYYLSKTPGGICPVADVTTGSYVCLLGIAKSTSVLAVNIQFPGVVV